MWRQYKIGRQEEFIFVSYISSYFIHITSIFRRSGLLQCPVHVSSCAFISTMFFIFQHWQYFYTALVSSFLIVCTYLHTKSRFLAPEWATKRVTLYSCLVLFGVIPATHWFFLMGGWTSQAVKVESYISPMKND